MMLWAPDLCGKWWLGIQEVSSHASSIYIPLGRAWVMAQSLVSCAEWGRNDACKAGLELSRSSPCSLDIHAIEADTFLAFWLGLLGTWQQGITEHQSIQSIESTQELLWWRESHQVKRRAREWMLWSNHCLWGNKWIMMLHCIGGQHHILPHSSIHLSKEALYRPNFRSQCSRFRHLSNRPRSWSIHALCDYNILSALAECHLHEHRTNLIEK